MVVVAVGMHTQFGIIKEMMLKSAEEREATPLQENLDGVAKCLFSFFLPVVLFVSVVVIGFVGMGFAAVTFVALTVRWGIHIGQDKSVWDKGRYMIKLVDYVIIALTIVVVAVPEVCWVV
jgi:magnesium-transporting ATPase (P-type)